MNERKTVGPEDMCEFIRGLSDERLDWLIVEPILGSDVLSHAATCETCGRRVEILVERDFAQLTPQEMQNCKTTARDPLRDALSDLLDVGQGEVESI